MSLKAFFLVILILVFGAFIYLKVQVLGNPNSHFNQTTRYALGQHPVWRTILGLHSVGDARAEYLQSTGTINIEWFAPEDENIDQPTLQQFAKLVGQYTSRPANVIYGGPLDDGTVPLSYLQNFVAKAYAEKPAGGSVLAVFFVQDYSPRAQSQLSAPFEESGIVVSLNALRSFLQSYPNSLNQYVLSSLLRQFGSQLGLLQTSGDSACVMDSGSALNGQPLSHYNENTPQDFCSSEQNEIANLKAQY